jgi:hypothetical protein
LIGCVVKIKPPVRDSFEGISELFHGRIFNAF